MTAAAAPTPPRLSAPQLLGVLARALPGLWRSAPGLVSLLALVQTCSGVLPALGVLLGKWTIDGVTRLAGAGPADGAGSDLTLLVLAWAGVAALSQGLAVAATILQGHITDHFTVQTVTRVMDKMGTLIGLDVLDDPRFHDDINVIQEGARSRPVNLLSTVSYLLENVVGAAALALTLLSIGWWVPLLVLAGLYPLAAGRIRLYQAGWGFALQRTQEARELAYDGQVALRAEYAPETRLYGLLPWLRGRYLTRATRYMGEMRGMRHQIVLGALPTQALALGVTAGLFAYAVGRAAAGQITVGSLLLVVGALSGLRASLSDVTDMLGNSTQILEWFGKYQAFLAAVPGVAAPVTPLPLPATLDLTLDGVTFRYPDGRLALDGVTLHIPHGQTVALVGENGAGKTTLARLLLRFYDPQQGQVQVGGHDLRHLDPQAWRAQVAAVFQDFARFEYTVRENILLGRPLDQARLDAAVAGSGLDAVLARLPAGLETRLGTAFGGTNLSGGQWQRLATARALYREAGLLILDEPTAALDPRAEKAVFESFARLAGGSGPRRTTLLITHRLGSVTLADRIVVLRAGRVVEDGTHAGLLARGGEYAELWALQARQYRQEDMDADELEVTTGD